LTGEVMPPRQPMSEAERHQAEMHAGATSAFSSPREPGNPFAQGLLFGGIGLFVLGLIIFVAGLGTEITYENPAGGAGAVMAGSGMIGMGWMLFVAWLATGSVNWQLRAQPRAQHRKMTSDAD
jgi:hypothetical protein